VNGAPDAYGGDHGRAKLDKVVIEENNTPLVLSSLLDQIGSGLHRFTFSTSAMSITPATRSANAAAGGSIRTLSTAPPSAAWTAGWLDPECARSQPRAHG
jgi:hypothetical protein